MPNHFDDKFFSRTDQLPTSEILTALYRIILVEVIDRDSIPHNRILKLAEIYRIAKEDPSPRSGIKFLLTACTRAELVGLYVRSQQINWEDSTKIAAMETAEKLLSAHAQDDVRKALKMVFPDSKLFRDGEVVEEAELAKQAPPVRSSTKAASTNRASEVGTEKQVAENDANCERQVPGQLLGRQQQEDPVLFMVGELEANPNDPKASKGSRHGVPPFTRTNSVTIRNKWPKKQQHEGPTSFGECKLVAKAEAEVLKTSKGPRLGTSQSTGTKKKPLYKVMPSRVSQAKAASPTNKLQLTAQQSNSAQLKDKSTKALQAAAQLRSRQRIPSQSTAGPKKISSIQASPSVMAVIKDAKAKLKEARIKAATQTDGNWEEVHALSTEAAEEVVDDFVWVETWELD
jgi:hypothetical protein